MERRMSAAAASILAFGIYLVALGTGLLLAPNGMLALFGRPSTSEPWLRVVGLVALVLGTYYAAAARAGDAAFFGWTVKGRLFGAAVLAILVVKGIAPAFVLLMAAADAAGAAWTAIASGRAG
jgi:uncharacterized protein YjeT (DUF2065 family)